ncbi:hypothetical protein LO80_05490 [Candidatus Francisella endociliophora]|uniref:Uncharacterized protein n=1 Tax=Candidatus Francisella endociliophora TaxID=653937 RepID=A0A097EPH5_9GAMM|nr:hypothetical protein [Francisella sp. FSC1006]AIT09472.1 hypothetical protein LO80_05490 [Francisella sp. FSC1006]
MSKKNLPLISFIAGVLSILFVVFIAVLFPRLEISAMTKNIILIVLLLPWVVFMLSLIFCNKDNK